MNISSERKAGIVFHTIPEVPWQYPVVTEKAAFESLYKCPEGFDADYFAFPWATIIDRYPEKFPLHRVSGFKKKDATVLAVWKRVLLKALSCLTKKTENTVTESLPPEFSFMGSDAREKCNSIYCVPAY